MKSLMLLFLTLILVSGGANAADSARFRCYGLDGERSKKLTIDSTDYSELGSHEGKRVLAKLADGGVAVMILDHAYFVSPVDRIVYRSVGASSSGTLLNCVNLDIEDTNDNLKKIPQL
jgi:hypothetical protein